MRNKIICNTCTKEQHGWMNYVGYCWILLDRLIKSPQLPRTPQDSLGLHLRFGHHDPIPELCQEEFHSAHVIWCCGHASPFYPSKSSTRIFWVRNKSHAKASPSPGVKIWVFSWFCWSPFFEAFVFTLEGHFSTCHAVKRCRVVFEPQFSLCPVSHKWSRKCVLQQDQQDQQDQQATCNWHLTHLDTFHRSYPKVNCLPVPPGDFCQTFHVSNFAYAINRQTNVSSNLLGTNKNV